MRFSATRLTTWQQCALQAKFQYEDKIPGRTHAKAAFGNCIHDALRWYDENGQDLDGAKKRFKETWHDPEKYLNISIDFWPTSGRISYGGLRAKGLEILDLNHERFKFDPPAQIIALEHSFLVPFGEHELTGVVDKLEVRKSGKGKEILRVIDYKSNSKRPTIAELTLNIQFTIYIYATFQREFWTGNGPDFAEIPNGEWLFETYKDMPRRAIWSHLMTGAEIDAGGRDAVEFERIYRVCQEIEKAIAADVHVPNISAETCGICSYANDPCPVRIPTQEELTGEAEAWV